MLTTKSCLSPIALLRRVLHEQQQSAANDNSQDSVGKSTPSLHDFIQDRKRRSVNKNSNGDSESINDENLSDIPTNITITPTMFVELCPALLVQIEQGACSEVVRVKMGKLEKGFGLGNRNNNLMIFHIPNPYSTNCDIHFSLDLCISIGSNHLNVWPYRSGYRTAN